mmetsp:Transcript_42127/g.111248  ORF Transcript_42127/g.111248 Transcript_42127/m.111248 type:complete len:438 (-) Transcript_42127:200-1513(-)
MPEASNAGGGDNSAPMDVEGKRMTPAKRAVDDPDGGTAQDRGSEVQKFLSSIGLSRYFSKLVSAGFDSMEALRAMEEEDMKQECGMLPGHIRLLQKHLAKAGCAVPAPRAIGQGDSAGKDRVGDAARRQAAREASSLALATATFGNASGAGASVSELLTRASSELRQLRPAAISALDGAAKNSATVAPQPRREPRAPRPPPGPVDESAKKAAREREEARQLEIARSELAAQFEEKYMAAMQAAQASLMADPDPAGADDTLAALAQLAEGSAQLVATAASFCANPQADAGVLAAVVDAAQQGAQRASWAAVAAVAYGDSDDFDKDWNQKMRRAAVQAAEVAEQYARDCAAAVKMVGKGKVVQRAFCKFHAENRCLKGNACEFSHDASVLTPLPLASKTELECVFYAKGQCTRGAGCPFAHGDEELNEVIRLKTAPGNG